MECVINVEKQIQKQVFGAWLSKFDSLTGDSIRSWLLLVELRCNWTSSKINDVGAMKSPPQWIGIETRQSDRTVATFHDGNSDSNCLYMINTKIMRVECTMGNASIRVNRLRCVKPDWTKACGSWWATVKLHELYMYTIVRYVLLVCACALPPSLCDFAFQSVCLQFFLLSSHFAHCVTIFNFQISEIVRTNYNPIFIWIN